MADQPDNIDADSPPPRSGVGKVFAALGEGASIWLEGPAMYVVGVLFLGLAVYVGWYAMFGTAAGHLLASVVYMALLPLVFLTTSVSKLVPRRTVFDYLLASLAFANGLYFVINREFYKDVIFGLTEISALEQMAGLVAVGLSFEASRRCVGLGLTTIVAFLLLYSAFGHFLSPPLHHKSIGLEYFIVMQTITENGIFGLPLQVAGTYVLLFVLFGGMYQRAGGGRLFFDVAAAISGRSIGGPAKACVVSSGFYGSISGSPVADVVTTGPITIPLMCRTGISPARAGAIESAASCGGAMLPPVMGAVAFLMVEFTAIQYHNIVLAGLLSAILYYYSVFTFIHVEARRFGEGTMADEEMPSILEALRSGWTNVIPLIVLIFLLSRGYSIPYIAAGSTVAVLVSSWFNSNPEYRLGPRALLIACAETAHRMTSLVAAVLAAGIIIGAIELTGLVGKFSLLMSLVAGDSTLGALIAGAVMLILFGMGMPTTGVYIMGAALLGPVLVAKFHLPMLETHMFMLYIACMSAITPPIAVACFAAATIAKANPMTIAIKAVKIGFAGFVLPFYFIYNPGLLLKGTVLEIGLDVVTAVTLLTAIIFALDGAIFGRQAPPWLRVLLIAAAIALMFPAYAVKLPALGALFAIALLYARLGAPAERRDLKP